MAKIPQYGTRKVTPSGRAAGAAIPFSVADVGQGLEAQALGAIGRGIGDVGDAVAKIAIAEGESQASSAAVQASAEIEKMNAGLKENNDPSTYDDTMKQTMETINGFMPESAIGQKRYKEFIGKATPQWEAGLQIRKMQTTRANIEADHITNLSMAVAGKDIELAGGLIDSAERTGVITPQEAANQRIRSQDTIAKSIKKDSVENIKPLMVEAVTVGDKQDGLNALNTSIDTLVDSGVLTKAEAAEADKVLGDWLDNYTSGRNQRAKAAIKQTTTGTYEEMMPLMIDPSVAQDRYQMVESSKMPNAVKEKWNAYIKGSYKEAPEATTRDGKQIADNAVYEANTLAITPTEAYDILMEARFVEGSITNDQYERSINRIQNPYPQDTTEAIRSAKERINNTIQNKGPNFFTSAADKERIVKISDSLDAWIERKSESGQYPTAEEVYMEGRRLSVTVQQPEETQITALPSTEYPPIPKKQDATYITTDEQFDTLEPGSLFYDAINNTWRRKPQAFQPVETGKGLQIEVF